MKQKIEQFTQIIKQAVVNKSLQLPSLPDVALKVREECDKEESSAQNIVDIISQDPALCVRLLQVANSSLYQGRSSTDDLTLAITRLGLKMVKNLIMSLAIKQLYRSSSSVVQAHFHELWLSSTKTAALSRILAKNCKHLNAENAMLSGLTHNIGALPILELAENDDDLFENPKDLYKITQQMQGEVGAYIFKTWHFPEFMTEVATNCYQFELTHQGPANYTDIVQVALVEGSIYTGLECSDDWASLPAFQQLNIDPETSILEIDDNRIVFEETNLLFS